MELVGIIRLQNDRLMSPSAISDYLSQVAPVPFSPSFRFGAKISHAMSRHTNLGELDIRVNDADEPIYRPHRDCVRISSKSTVKFRELSFVEVPGLHCDIAAVAWILHHNYQGALPNRTLVKGLRMRTGDMQIGGHTLLEDLFPETRFNSWAVGEVHVIDPRITPNGRRDHFEPNAHFQNLVNHLTPTARDIARRCRTSSVQRKWKREFELCEESVEEQISIIAQGSTSKGKRKQLALSAEQKLFRMNKLAGKRLLADAAHINQQKIEHLHEQLSNLMNDKAIVSSPLMRLPEDRRKTYQYFFDLIYECSVNRSVAKALIDRILLRLEK